MFTISNCCFLIWQPTARFCDGSKMFSVGDVRTDSFVQLLIIKPTRCTNFSYLFWNKTLHVSNSSSAHHQEFFNVHAVTVYVILVCWQLTLLCVQWKTLDDGQRNCPKHVEFYSKNKFEKLVHLVVNQMCGWPCIVIQCG
jgi:hypothetical protein